MKRFFIGLMDMMWGIAALTWMVGAAIGDNDLHWIIGHLCMVIHYIQANSPSNYSITVTMKGSMSESDE